MTLMEAIKSGKRFRLKNSEHKNWNSIDETQYFAAKYTDLISDEWEIENLPEAITFKIKFICRELFHNIPNEVLNKMSGKKWECVATELKENE